MQWNADDPAAQVNRGNFHAARGQAQLAEQAYRDAIKLEPAWLPAYINWADHLRINNRDNEAKAVLQLSHIARPPKIRASVLSMPHY